MIRRFVQSLALVAWAAEAVTVPQKDATAYIFSRPNVASNIVGRVIGSPAEYSVIRSEDIAYLVEAYNERAAILSMYTDSPGQSENKDSSHIKRVRIGSSNYYAGFDALENPYHDTAGYLTTDDDRYVRGVTVHHGPVPYITNECEVVKTTVATSNAFSIITMPIFPAEEDVWTNRWTVHYPVVTTTKVQRVYYDRANFVFDDCKPIGYTAPWPGYIDGPFRADIFGRFYKWLDGMSRILTMADWVVSPTNGVVTSWSSQSPDSSYQEVVRSSYRIGYSSSEDGYAGFETRPTGSGRMIVEVSMWNPHILHANNHDRLARIRAWCVAEVYHIKSVGDAFSQDYHYVTTALGDCKEVKGDNPDYTYFEIDAGAYALCRAAMSETDYGWLVWGYGHKTSENISESVSVGLSFVFVADLDFATNVRRLIK